MGDEPSSESQERTSFVDSFNTINRGRDNRAKAQLNHELGSTVTVNSLFGHDKGVKPTDLGHTNLSFEEALHVSMNPASELGSLKENAIAGVQALIPGGTLVGLGRAAVMQQGSKTPAAAATSGRGTNTNKSGGGSPRNIFMGSPLGSGGRTLQNDAAKAPSPFGDDGGNEELFKLGTNGPAPTAAPTTAASLTTSLAQQQTNEALKKRRQIGGFSLFGHGGSGGTGFLS